MAVYDAKTGKEAWKFYTIPAPGEPGNDSWQGESWKTGAGSVWVTGSYDPDLNLTYWGIGNLGPDWNPDQRRGDNLYTDSVVALDADTGKLRWHFQFTPNDAYDYDSVQVPVLADIEWQGKPRKVMMWANRNGYFYVLDRATGEFLLGKPFVKVNSASGLDAKGRPVQTPQPFGSPTWPGNQGATNWYPPSFSPRTGLFYVSAWGNYRRSTAKKKRSTSPDATSRAAASQCSRQPPARRPSASAGAAPSTTGPMKWAAAPRSPSIHERASTSGISSSSTSTTREF